MNEARPVDVRAELERLARLYRSKLGSELDQLKAQAAALNPVEPPSLELLQTVHRLAGSSLTFGHDALGGHLQQIEARIVAARAEARPAREVLAAVDALQWIADGLEAICDPVQPGSSSVAKLPEPDDAAAEAVQARTSLPRAPLLDRYGWISPEIESAIQAYGFDIQRVEPDNATARADLLIECGIVPSADTLRRRVRGSDFVGRLGGEAFLVAFEDCTSANALHLLERLAREFSGMRFEVEQKHWSCTFSAGIADLALGDSPQALLARADRALYRAKAEGRNRCLIDVLPPLTDSTQSV